MPYTNQTDEWPHFARARTHAKQLSVLRFGRMAAALMDTPMIRIRFLFKCVICVAHWSNGWIDCFVCVFVFCALHAWSGVSSDTNWPNLSGGIPFYMESAMVCAASAPRHKRLACALTMLLLHGYVYKISYESAYMLPKLLCARSADLPVKGINTHAQTLQLAACRAGWYAPQ